MPKRNPLNGVKIGLVGRGGAGKTTVAVLLARALRRWSHQVCVLDVDSTNEGLHAALGLKEPPRPLIDFFGGMVFRGGRVGCPVDDPSLLFNAEVRLDELPASYVARNEQGVCLLCAGKLADYGVGAGCDGPMIKIARDLRLRDPDGDPVMLVDCKAGLEDASRGIAIGLDQLVVVVDPSTAGIALALSMARLLEQLRAGAKPATAHLESQEMVALAEQLYRESRLTHMHVVLNRVTTPSVATLIESQLARRGLRPAASLPDVAALRQAWLRGDPLPDGDYAAAMEKLAQALVGAAASTPTRSAAPVAEGRPA